MADVNGLLADPEFKKLDNATQRTVLGRIDPAFNSLSDSDYLSFRDRMQAPSTFSKVMGTLGEVARFPIEVAKGQAKNIAGNVLGAVNLGVQLHNAAVPGWAAPPIPPPVSKETMDKWTAPRSTGEQIGKTGSEIAEFALPGMGVSKLTKGAGLLIRMGAEALGTGGVAAIQTGGDPASIASAAATGVVGPALGAVGAKFAPRLYQSALKPTWNMVKKEGLEMVDTGLKEGVPVTHKGLAMIEGRIEKLGSEIKKGILYNAAQGKTVDSTKVLSTLDELESFYRNTGAPDDGLKVLKDLREEFTRNHGQTIPIDVAQKIKVNTYRLLKKSYGEFKGAKVEGLKQEARGLKEQISSVFPEIAGLNEKQSKLLGLDESLTRAVWRIDNHQMMGIGSGIAATAGHAMLGGAGAIAWFAGKMLLDDPGMKSKLAIALYRAGVKNAPKVVGARLAALKGAMANIASKSAEGQAQPVPPPPQ